VSQYLTRPAIEAVFRYVLSLPALSRIDFTFSVPPVADDHDAVVERAMPELRGEPRLSYFAPEEMLEWLRELGFSRWDHLSPALCEERYFAGRTDGLPVSHRIQSICAYV
jgi:O-methyltransferase involved in polyketide biosynthesis